MKNPKGSYRFIQSWDETDEWQCLSCYKHYHNSNKDPTYIYCPRCGTKLEYFAQKRSQKYVRQFKQYFPTVEVYTEKCLLSMNLILLYDTGRYSWPRTSLIRDIKKYVVYYGKDKIRIFVKRWNGIKKEIKLGELLPNYR